MAGYFLQPRNTKTSTILLVFVLFGFLSGYSQIDTAKVNLIDTNGIGANIPVFSASGGEAESEIEEQDQSSLLQSSRDVFVQFSIFQFAAGRYRMRGYPSENQLILFNGLNVSNLETGYTVWNQWGGLNDVTRFAENRFGNTSNRYGFSGAGGYVNIDSKASSFRKGTRVSYSFGNRLFKHRMMVTHSTGMMENGWALTVSASGRYGDEVYVPGTFYNSNAFYLSLDKKLNEKHLFTLTALTAQTNQGRNSPEQLETFSISGNNFYNSNWGFQNGKVRNASVSSVNKPIIMLTHTNKISTSSQLVSSLLYTFGKSGITALNWSDNAANPRPNYYRNLPSYFYQLGDTAAGDLKKEEWENDITTSQLNWDKMYAVNSNNLYTPPGAIGQGINTTDTRARYVLENRIENLKNFGFNTVYSKRLDNLFLTVGGNANIYRNRKYKEMEDLLGATFWMDYDQFADNLGVENSVQQNDLENPDKKIYKNDRFGYDYSINVNRAEIWTQAEWNFNQTDFYIGGTLSNSTIWREGYWANGKFPDNSKGLSEKANFLNYGLKAGFTYKISGRHFLTLNGSYVSRNPEVGSVFISPRVRNTMVTDLDNEKVISGDLNYLIKYPTLKLRFTGYYTQVNNQTWLRTFWSDEFNNNVNLIMKGLNQNYSGIEFGVEKTFFTEHVVQAALGLGQFIYTNRPTLEAWQDNNSTQLYSNRTSYLINYKMGGTPQSVLGAGYRYNARSHWFAGVFFNYFDQIYVDVNPDRRTEEALNKYYSNEEEAYREVIKQEQLPAYFILNAQAGKSFRIQRKHYLNFNLVVYNLLNDKSNITTGFEQLRWDPTNIKRFDNKYYYMQGTTFMLTASFTFN